MTLRKKIMFAIVFLVFIPVTIMGVVSYMIFTDTIDKKTSDFYWVSLQETDRKLNFALNEINTISDVGIVSPQVQQLLKNDNYALSDSDRQDLNNLFLGHPHVFSFSLYAKQDLVYTSDRQHQFQYESIAVQTWFTVMRDRKGRPFWLGPYENPLLSQQPMLLTHVREVKDYYSLDTIGILVILVKPDVLEQVFWDASTLHKGDILLANEQGKVLYSQSGQLIGQEASFPYMREDSLRKYYVERFNDVKMLISPIQSVMDGWYLIALNSMADLQAESRNIRNIALGLLALSLVSALLFDLMFVSRLVKAIIRVVHGMKRGEQGNFTDVSLYAVNANDESGMLVTGFNRMSVQIKELIQRVEYEQVRKKEAEMQALVAQINPHFIYNSLESINSLAVLQGNREISRMVISLGKLLRISISESQELIPLGMEIEHVMHYLYIQKVRFEDKFDYVIDIPEKAKMCLTEKLIIQPIVENALYHGIESMYGKGVVSIKVLMPEGADWLFIEVADNGSGFDLEKLESLFSSPILRQNKYQHSGVGLKNVHERLRIRFGTPYGLMACSSPDEGTVVRLRIPRIV